MNTLYKTLHAIATAKNYEEALEALELAEALQERAFTAGECAVAAVVLDSAQKRVEAYMGAK